MVLFASALLLAASAAGLVMLGSAPLLGELSALGFALSLFIVICATELGIRFRAHACERQASRPGGDIISKTGSVAGLDRESARSSGTKPQIAG